MEIGTNLAQTLQFLFAIIGAIGVACVVLKGE